MNKTIITELERAREIMGLKPIEHTLLNEQRKQLVDNLMAIFSKTTSRKVAQEYAEMITKLLSKSSNKTLENVLTRMRSTVNSESVNGKIVSIIGGAGEKYSIKNIRTIIRNVTNGKLRGEDLNYILNQLPKELADGSGFRSSFGKQMKNIEKGVIKAEKEAIEKVEKEAIEKAEKEAIEKAEKETIEREIPTEQSLKDLIDINIKQSGQGWWKDLKLRLRNVFRGKNVDGDVLLLKNNAILKWMEKVGIKDMGDLLAKLNDAKKQALMGASSGTKTAIEKMNPEELVEQLAVVLKENAERISKGQPMYDLPPGLVDEIQTILMMSNNRKMFLPELNTAWVRRRIKDIDAAIKKGGKSDAELNILVKEKDDLLKAIVGTHVDDVTMKSLGVFEAEITRTTMGGMGRWMIRDIMNISKTLGLFTISLIISSITNAILNQFGGTKAIAGLTKNLYEKFRGHKWMVQIKGGLSDANAKKAALVLKKYVRGWALIRDWATSSNFEDG